MLTRLPIKLLAPLLFGIPVLAVGLWLSMAWNRQSQKAVSGLADQSIEQIHSATAGKIADVLATPMRLCQVNQHLVASGVLPTDDLPSWRQTLVRESRAFGMISSIVWGGADGRAAWVSRYADGATYWAIKSDGSQPTMEEWKLDENGEPMSDARKSFDFELTARPWYQAPVSAKKPAWCEPYVWVGGGDADEKTLGISFGVPLYEENGELLGVVDADFSLNDLSGYLSKLKIGKTGVAVLASSDGRLLASSGGGPIVSRGGERIAAADSPNPLVAAVGTHALAGDPESLGERIDVAGEPHLVRVSPVGDQAGLDWLLLTIVPEQDFVAEIDAAFARSWLTSLLAVAIAVAIGLLAARWMVSPLTRLVSAVRRIGQGDLETRIDMHHAPEYVKLAEEINRMTGGLQDRMRMQKSLSLAMEVQRNLLPEEDPRLDGLDIAGHSTYCDETGGDYYDFLDISGTDGDSALLVIGDVMGHGVAAALLMATARGILRSRSEAPGSLADFLCHLNDMLVADTGGERFMTMLLVTLSAKDDQLRWASAGHGPPVVYDPQSDSFAELDGGGLPLGLMEDEAYTEYTLPGVKPGAIIFVSTDGLEETANDKGELYGADRLMELIRKNADKPAERISQIIRESLAFYRGSNAQEDDLTFVVAKVLG